VIDERNRQYLREVTTDHIDILDPTGRAHRVDPSKITDIPDASFGLGKSSRIPSSSMTRIVDKIRNQLKVEENDFGEYQRLTRRSQSASGQETTPLLSQLSIASSIDDSSVIDPGKINQYQTLANIKNQTNPSNPPHIPGAEGLTSTINILDDKDKQQLLALIKEDNDNLNATQATASQSDSFGKKTYPRVKQSPYEEMLFEKAILKQQKFIEEGTQQIAGGKVFKGQAFVSSPPEIIFTDFEVNSSSSYKQKFILTNTSYTFNSFRLLPLADNVIDFFEIIYTKPGRLSAGVSCQLVIQFTPKLNQDIQSKIEFYSETGPFSIPLSCFIKRCIPQIINPKIDFGEVIIGQQMKVALKLKNTGALRTRYVIEVITAEESKKDDENKSAEDDETTEEKDKSKERSRASSYAPIDENQLESAKSQLELSSRVQRKVAEPIRKRLAQTPRPLSIAKTTGVLEGYSDASVMILCAPLSLGEHIQKFQITFQDLDLRLKSIDPTGRYVTHTNEIFTSCYGQELPIYLPIETIDMKCTLYDRIYRKRFEISNRSSNTYVVNIKIPYPLNKYLEVNPTTVYVQPNLSQVVNLKFDPKESLVEDMNYFSLSYGDFQDAASLLIPFEIQVASLLSLTLLSCPLLSSLSTLHSILITLVLGCESRASNSRDS
jgi:hypothetical protein